MFCTPNNCLNIFIRSKRREWRKKQTGKFLHVFADRKCRQRRPEAADCEADDRKSPSWTGSDLLWQKNSEYYCCKPREYIAAKILKRGEKWFTMLLKDNFETENIIKVFFWSLKCVITKLKAMQSSLAWRQ